MTVMERRTQHLYVFMAEKKDMVVGLSGLIDSISFKSDMSTWDLK